MIAILNFSIYRKTVSFTAWHMVEMDSAQQIHLETMNAFPQKCLQVFI